MQGGHKETLTIMYYTCVETDLIFGAHMAQNQKL